MEIKLKTLQKSMEEKQGFSQIYHLFIGWYEMNYFPSLNLSLLIYKIRIIMMLPG